MNGDELMHCLHSDFALRLGEVVCDFHEERKVFAVTMNSEGPSLLVLAHRRVCLRMRLIL